MTAKQKRLGIGLCFTLALSPIWLFKYTPATDLPTQMAISSVLYRLLGSDAAIKEYYALNLQPVPYHLAYVISTPLVGLFGPYLGAKLFLTLIAAACLGSGTLLLRTLGKPWSVTLGCLFMLYGISFFYGFVTYLFGIPLVLVAAWALVRAAQSGQRHYLVLGCASGTLGCLSHVILVLPWAISLASYLFMRPRRNLKAALVVGLVSLAPVALMLLSSLVSAGGSSDAFYDGVLREAGYLEYDSLRDFIHHLKVQFAVFDNGLGCVSHLFFLALVGGATLLTWLKNGWRPSESYDLIAWRFSLSFLVLSVAIYCFTPIAAQIGGVMAWGINIRYFGFVEIALLSLFPNRLPHRRLRWISVFLLATYCVHVGALMTLWGKFDRSTRMFEPILAEMKPNQSLLPVMRQSSFESAWPPLQLHVHAYYLASGGAFDVAVSSGGNLPIRQVKETKILSQPLSGIQLGEFRYLLVQSSPNLRQDIQPKDGRLVARSGVWALYEKIGQTAPEEGR